jgi:hemerythrin-like domain-containing protein
VIATQLNADRTDTTDMVAVHRVFRDAFGCAAQLVGSVCGEQPDRVEPVATFYANVLAFLQAHHQGEDELLWPKLHARVGEQAATVARVAEQHDAVSAAIDEARRSIDEWKAAPDIDRGAALAVALATLGMQLGEHLDDEERLVLPLAADHISPEEWRELPAHGMRTFAGDKQWLVIGLIQEQLPPPAVEAMTEAMPDPIRDAWLGEGRQRYADFIAQLRR